MPSNLTISNLNLKKKIKIINCTEFSIRRSHKRKLTLSNSYPKVMQGLEWDGIVTRNLWR